MPGLSFGERVVLIVWGHIEMSQFWQTACASRALPWPLERIFGLSRRLYSTCIPPVSHHILRIPLYPRIYLHLAILQQIHGIPHPAVSASHCIQLYPYVSSCIQLYPAVSHCNCIPPPQKRDMTKNTLQGRAQQAARTLRMALIKIGAGLGLGSARSARGA